MKKATGMTARWGYGMTAYMVAYAILSDGSWWVTNHGTGKSRKVKSQDAAYEILMNLNRPKNHGGEYNTVIVERI